MLGRFLEFSTATPDIQASLDFYGKLGFSQADVGEAWPHPYAVVTDGRICIGLHQHSMPAPSITFVKPDLLKHLDALEQLGIEFEFRHLGNDVFNEVGWLDPFDHRIRLVEARTFSPSKRLATDNSLCGYFLEIALSAHGLADAKSYWERFGFVGIDESDAQPPRVSCTSDTIDVGLYELKQLRRPTLLFETDDVAARVVLLAELGIEPSGELPMTLKQSQCATFTAPEGTPIVLAQTAVP
jgi:catechol 2,3-dioxygenase-like lactoylglutathione lyase family enzyme